MKWYLEMGPDGDVAVSTRIRLARNLAEYPFPSRLNPAAARKVDEQIKTAFFAAQPSLQSEFTYYDMEQLTPARAMSMAERHLISPDFAQKRDIGALLLSNDESVSIMLNEEDHVRIQAMLPGMQLGEALQKANRYDDLLDSNLHFAFDENLGYLTACPTNLGTGLRASVMLHLPAIAQSGTMQSLANAIAKLGLTIRGMFGEGSVAKGAFFQISNQVTLGITEAEAVENLKSLCRQITAQERAAREALKKISPAFEDRVFRSLGTLRSARLLSNDEFMSLISDVRLGILTGIITDVNVEAVNELINSVQPATLTASAGRSLDPAARDALRAQKVREKISPCRS